jgi:hypothetical protein
MSIETKINEGETIIYASVHKKETDWNEKHNYIGEGELRTTITLDEYRELLVGKATADEKLRALQEYIDGLKKNEEVNRLKDELAKRKEEVEQLKVALHEAIQEDDF